MQGHVSDTLAAYVDRQLPPDAMATASAHLAECDRCREALAQHEFASAMIRQLSIVQAPVSIWSSIEQALASDATTVDRRSLTVKTYWPLALAVAAMLILAASAAVYLSIDRSAPYDVVRVDSSSGRDRVSIGEWIETSATSRVRIKLGEIGTVDIAPNTRMQLIRAQANEHRLKLARGSISAQILAPPRLFFVETPSATVVDLGCAYTMEVDEGGVGRLRVTSGWASLETDKFESLVPAGASCPTRPEGPGTPAFDDASERLRRALLEFDYSNGGQAAIDMILAESRQRDTLTLWHLLSRVAMEQRPRIFERMVALTPLPAGVARDKVLALEPAMLKLWREELAWTW